MQQSRTSFSDMDDSILELTERERQQESESQPPRSNNTPTMSDTSQAKDLADTFELFKTYLDVKLVDLKSDLLTEQESMSKKFRDDSNIKFRSEGNKIQFRFNEEILAGLIKISKSSSNSATAAVTAELMSKIRDRNKLIRIADSSAGGWTTVREYESNDIAENEEDEKKIRQAENRALKVMKDKAKPRGVPYARPVPPRSETAPNPAFANMFVRNTQPPFRGSYARREPCPWDLCHLCKQYGHWRKNCPLNFKFQNSTNNTISNTNSTNIKQQ